jgi:hypothetical protein
MKVNEIFTPGDLPSHTYYDRSSLNLEFKLLEAIETRGYICSVSGPSKSGKTVLCESVIGRNRMLLVTGAGIQHEDQFWQKLRAKLKLPNSSTHSRASGTESEIKASGEASLQIPFVVQGKGGIEAATSTTRGKEQSETYDGPNGVSLLEYIEGCKYTLVVDDFHYDLLPLNNLIFV